MLIKDIVGLTNIKYHKINLNSIYISKLNYSSINWDLSLSIAEISILCWVTITDSSFVCSLALDFNIFVVASKSYWNWLANAFSVVVDGCISIINDQRFTGIIESKSAGLSVAEIVIFSQTFFSGQKSVWAVEAANVLVVTGINSDKTKKCGSEYEFHDCKI